MTRYVVLLRAVNVGGHNKVPMPRLREIAADLGYADAATYVQSGNLVVTAPGSATTVQAAVAEALRRDLDVSVDVMVRSRQEIAAVLAANPFAEIATDDKRLLVSFLSGPVSKEHAAALDEEQFLPERFAVGDRCLYQWYPDGVGRSKMAAAPWDKRLGVRGTGRNWRTVKALLDLA